MARLPQLFQPAHHNVSHALLLCAILAVLGCQSTPGTTGYRGDPNSTAVSEEPGALVLAAQRSAPQRAAQLYLRASEIYLEQAQTHDAISTADRIVSSALIDSNDIDRYNRLMLELALRQKTPDQAERAYHWLGMANLDEDATSDARARICAASGQWACAAQELLQIRYPRDARTHNNQIWDYLQRAGQTGLMSSDDLALGWWELRSIGRDTFSITEQRDRFRMWQETFPGHPAQYPLPDALSYLTSDEPPFRKVALFVPLQGRLAAAGNAIRDGFVSAYLTDAGRQKPEVLIYDTATESIGALYERALLSGAEAIIGPLEKENVEALQQINTRLPALALNYLDAQPEREFDSETTVPYQLGLAIEDEARTIAERLSNEGYERILLVASQESWANRATEAFQDSWAGELVIARFADMKTVTESVGTAMNVDDSHTRHRALARLLGESPEFLPRARRDVQAVVTFVTHMQAQATVPALRFHFAGDLPVFSTSQAIRNANNLRTLNGFHITELPLFIPGDPLGDDMMPAFGLQRHAFAALYALGVDAYRVSQRLQLLDRWQMALPGSTGTLTLAADHRFSRRLGWARIAGGEITTDR